MGAIYASWGISGAVLLVLSLVIGLAANKRIDGILIDERGRYSLTHLQLFLWTITILSLLSGVFFGRLVHGVANPVNIKIPAQILGLLGISLGSAVVATTIKRTKDVSYPDSVAASGGADFAPRLAQIFLVEEGAFADEVVDISKFQDFIVTILLVVAYNAIAVNAISAAGTAQNVTALPTISSTLLVLFGISHGAYVTAKVPTSSGAPALSMATRNDDRESYLVQKRAPLVRRQAFLNRRRQGIAG